MPLTCDPAYSYPTFSTVLPHKDVKDTDAHWQDIAIVILPSHCPLKPIHHC